jgi:hypothetical protein
VVFSVLKIREENPRMRGPFDFENVQKARTRGYNRKRTSQHWV